MIQLFKTTKKKARMYLFLVVNFFFCLNNFDTVMFYNIKCAKELDANPTEINRNISICLHKQWILTMQKAWEGVWLSGRPSGPR